MFLHRFVCSLTDHADAILIGRVSYQLINSHWPTAASKPGATKNEIKYSNWYNSVPKFVVSKILKVPGETNTHVISESVETKVSSIKQQAGKNILIFGSPTTTHSLFEQNLIDSFWLIVHPVIFGNGIPFFRERNVVTKLKLLTSKQLNNGTLVNNYSISK